MFFDKVSDIEKIASQTPSAIFVVSPDTKLKFKNVSFLRPAEDNNKSGKIKIEQMRDFLTETNRIETHDRYFVISPADAMDEATQDTFLKTLEEPRKNCHFILLTEHPGRLKPTILSRAHLYRLRKIDQLGQPPQASKTVLADAKTLITLKSTNLVSFADKISKKKPSARNHMLDVTEVAIELLYKSYFKTKDEKWLRKIPKFIKLYDALSRNGILKLQFIANLI